jgi:hypothetical protein
MIAFFLSLWSIVPSVNAWMDRKGAKRNYLLVGLVRGMAAVLHGALFFPSGFYFHGRPVWELSWGELLAIYVPIFLFQGTSFWILFELLLNILRKKLSLNIYSEQSILYYDHKEKDSGWIDGFFKWLGPKAGPIAHAVAKVAALILCILSIITIYYQRA